MSDIPSKPRRQVGLTAAERLEKYRFDVGTCWETSLDPKHKYPQINIRGRKITVHRLSYVVHVGQIPDGLHVLHKCDNPRCHRPDHLFVGTVQDNMKDMVAKGRHRAAPKMILDEDLIVNLGSVLSQTAVAECMEVSQTTVSKILRANQKSRGRNTSFGKDHGRGGRIPNYSK
jgi:hypothetical protein